MRVRRSSFAAGVPLTTTKREGDAVMKKFIIICYVVMIVRSVLAELVVINGYTWIYSVSSSKATITGVSPQPTGALSIPASLGGCDVEAIGDYVFQNCNGLTDITFPEGLKRIGRRSFADCYALSNIIVPKEMQHMGYQAFKHCPNIKTIQVDSLYAWCQITFGSQAGNPMCESGALLYTNGVPIVDVVIPNGLSQINPKAFNGGRLIKSVVIPPSVKIIGWNAFADCGLTNVIMSSGLTEIGRNAFGGCESVITRVPGHIAREMISKNSEPSTSEHGDLPVNDNFPNRNRSSMQPDIVSTVECFDSLSAVRSHFLRRHDMSKMDWSKCINSHGRKEETYSCTTTLWSDGSWSQSWQGNSRKNCGSIIVVPVSDFKVEKSFAYKNVGIWENGKVVSVEISIICTNPNISGEISRKAVLNYVENGMNIPRINSNAKAYGGGRDKGIILKHNGQAINGATRAGRLISLKSAAKKRFGAAVCTYMEGDSADGRVRILLLGCKVERE